MARKKEGRSVQTENNRKMCKHIKDKEKLPFPTSPFAPKQDKKSAKDRQEMIDIYNLFVEKASKNRR